MVFKLETIGFIGLLGFENRMKTSNYWEGWLGGKVHTKLEGNDLPSLQQRR